jgi:hypothetical protein
MSNIGASSRSRPRVGLVVAFATLGDEERKSVEVAWDAASAAAKHWTPAFVAYGLDPVTELAGRADILVYLGESSRFAGVAAEASRTVPVLLVKSTVAALLNHEPGAAPRYRMCTSVRGVSGALASVAPLAPTVDWETLPWPRDLAKPHMDAAERSYVNLSVGAFREAAEARGIRWRSGLPMDSELFSVFLTMHEPASAILAQTALKTWPQCTVLTADGMVSPRAPDGSKWSARLLRVRHWSRQSRSESNRRFREALGEAPPDFDSAGMVFGAMCYLDGAFSEGVSPDQLHLAGWHPGPLGPMRMTPSGRPQPERVVFLRGAQMQVVRIAH